MFRYYVVDKHTLFIDSLSAALGEHGLVCCGSSGDPLVALRELRRKEPEIVLIEFALPDIEELIAKVKKSLDRVSILIVTSLSPSEYAMSALRLGVEGFVSKAGGLEELIDAIEGVMSGDIVLPDEFAQHVFARLARSRPVAPIDELSLQERRVFERLGEGHAVKDIAAELAISAASVRTYIRRIRKKLDIPGIKLLRRYAYMRVARRS